MTRRRQAKSATQRGYGVVYQRARAAILGPSGNGLLPIDPPCHWCGKVATTADHEPPIDVVGHPHLNLVPACGPCNFSRRPDRSERWRRSKTQIVLVYGPPAGGKTTYVEQHRSPSDLVVDFDTIAQALGSPVGHDHSPDIVAAAKAARGALLTKLRKGDIEAARAWIVSSNPEALALFPHHEAVLIDPGIDEVKARATAAGRPNRWFSLIDEWYAAATKPSTDAGRPSAGGRLGNQLRWQGAVPKRSWVNRWA